MFGTDHSLSFLKLTLQLDEVFRSFPSIPNFTLIHFFVAGRNVCLSLCGGSHVAKSIFSNSAKRYCHKDRNARFLIGHFSFTDLLRFGVCL